MPARFFRIQHFCLVSRVQSMGTAKVQDTTGTQNPVELRQHVAVA
jgi:hypothetical protein